MKEMYFKGVGRLLALRNCDANAQQRFKVGCGRGDIPLRFQCVNRDYPYSRRFGRLPAIK